MEPVQAATSSVEDRLHLDPRQQFWAAMLGCFLIGLLLITRFLSPSSSGMGTHQQLGLPSCTFDSLFGIRCPTCGMTTSWSHFMRGELAASWAANPGGTCLAMASAIAGVWSFVTAARARYRPLVSTKIAFAIGLAIAAITLIDWVGRIF